MSIFDDIGNSIKSAANAVVAVVNVVVATVVAAVVVIVQNPVSAFSAILSGLNVFTRLDLYSQEKFNTLSAADLNKYAGNYQWISLTTASGSQLINWLTANPSQAAQLNTAWAYITPSMIASLSSGAQVALTDVALMGWLTSSSAPFAKGWDDINQSLSRTVAPLSNNAFATFTASDLNAIAQLDGRFTGLSNGQIQAWLALHSIQTLPMSVFKWLSADMINSLTVLQITQISAIQLGQISSTQFGLLSYQTINNFSVVALSSMTVAQLKNIAIAVFGALGASFLNNLPVTLLSSVTPTQLGAVSAAAFGTLSATILAQLTSATSGITGPQILAWFAVDGHTSVKQLSVELFSHLSPAVLSVLTAKLVSTITLEQFKSLGASQVGAFGAAFSGMTSDNLKALSKAQSAGISGIEIKNLSSIQFSYFTADAISGLGQDAVSNISASQINILLSDYIVAFASTFGFLQNDALAMMSSSQWGVVTKVEIQSLSTTTLAGFTAVMVGKLLPAQIPFFSASQIGALGTAFGGMTQDSLKALTHVQSAGITGTEIKNLSPTQFSYLTADAISGLGQDAVSKISTSQISILLPDRITAFAAAFGFLQNDALAMMSSSQWGVVTKTEIQSLSTTTLGGFTPATLGKITPAQIPFFSPAQIGSFGLAFAGMSNPDLQALSAEQAVGLTSTEMGALTTTQIPSLNATILGGLTAAAAGGITATEISLFNPVQVRYLGANFGALSDAVIQTLSVAQINALTPLELSALSYSESKLLTADFLKLLTSVQLNGFKSDQMAALSWTQISAFSPAQLSSLNAKQVAWINNETFSQMTASQVAGLSHAALFGLTLSQLALLVENGMLTPRIMSCINATLLLDAPSSLFQRADGSDLIDVSVLAVLDPAILGRLKSKLSIHQITVLASSKASRILSQQVSGFKPANVSTLSQFTMQLQDIYTDLNSTAAISTSGLTSTDTTSTSSGSSDSKNISTKQSDAADWFDTATATTNTIKTGYKHQTYSRIINDAWRDMVDMNLNAISSSTLSSEEKNKLTLKLESLKKNSQLLLRTRVLSMLALIADGLAMLVVQDKKSYDSSLDRATAIMPLVGMIVSGLQTIISSNIKAPLTKAAVDFLEQPKKNVMLDGKSVSLKYRVWNDFGSGIVTTNTATTRTQVLSPWKQLAVQSPFLLADAMGIACDILNLIKVTQGTDKMKTASAALSLVSDFSFLVGDTLPIFAEKYSPIENANLSPAVQRAQASVGSQAQQIEAANPVESQIQAPREQFAADVAELRIAEDVGRVAKGISVAARAALVVGAVVGMVATIFSSVSTFIAISKDTTSTKEAKDAAISFASISLGLTTVMIVGSFIAPILAPIGLVLSVVLMLAEVIYGVVEQVKAEERAKAAAATLAKSIQDIYKQIYLMVNGDVKYLFIAPSEGDETINPGGNVYFPVNKHPTHWGLDKEMLAVEGDFESNHNTSIFSEIPIQDPKLSFSDPDPVPTYMMSYIEYWVIHNPSSSKNISSQMSVLIQNYNAQGYKLDIYYAWRAALINDRIMSTVDGRGATLQDLSQRALSILIGRLAFGLSQIATQVFYSSVISMQDIFTQGFYLPLSGAAIQGRQEHNINALVYNSDENGPRSRTMSFGNTRNIVPINNYYDMTLIDLAGTWNAQGNGRFILEVTDPTESNGANFTVMDIWDFFNGKLVNAATADSLIATKFDAAFILTGGVIDNKDSTGLYRTGVITMPENISVHHSLLWELMPGGNFEMHTSSTDINDFFDLTDNTTKVTIYGTASDSLKVQDSNPGKAPHVVMLIDEPPKLSAKEQAAKEQAAKEASEGEAPTAQVEGKLSVIEQAAEQVLEQAGLQAVKVYGLNNLIGSVASATTLYDRGTALTQIGRLGNIIKIPDYLYIYNPDSTAYGGQDTILVATGGGKLIGGAGSSNQFLINSGNVTTFGAATAWQEVVLSAFGDANIPSDTEDGTKNSLPKKPISHLKSMVINEVVTTAPSGNFFTNSADNKVSQIATYSAEVRHEDTGPESFSGTLVNMDGYTVGGGDNNVALRQDGSIVRVNNIKMDIDTNSFYYLWGDSETVQTSWGKSTINVWGKNVEIVTGRGNNTIKFHPDKLNNALDSGQALLLMGTGRSDIDLSYTNIVASFALTLGQVNITEGSGDHIISENLASVQASGNGPRYVNGKLYQGTAAAPQSTFSDLELTIHLDPELDSHGNWSDMGTTQFNLHNFYLTDGNSIKVVADVSANLMSGFDVIAQASDGSKIANLARIDFSGYALNLNAAATMSNLNFNFDDNSYASVNLSQVVNQPSGILISASM